MEIGGRPFSSSSVFTASSFSSSPSVTSTSINSMAFSCIRQSCRTCRYTQGLSQGGILFTSFVHYMGVLELVRGPCNARPVTCSTASFDIQLDYQTYKNITLDNMANICIVDVTQEFLTVYTRNFCRWINKNFINPLEHTTLR